MNVEEFFSFDYNWYYLLWLLVILILVYLFLLFSRKVLFGLIIVGRLRSVVQRLLDKILILYEPFSLIILAGVFVMIKPAFHGLIGGFIVLLTYQHMRNYLHGKLIMTAGALRPGRRLHMADQEGIISHLGRFGILIRSDHGVHHIPYHALVTGGYILSSGDKVGGYYNLLIKFREKDENKKSIIELSDILISSPYVDLDHKPEISRYRTSDDSISVKLLVKQEDHLYDLMALLEENGYQSEITKS